MSGSFRVQLAVVCAASIAICAMAGVVVYDSFARSRQALIDDAGQQCLAAIRELNKQVRDRNLYGGEAIAQLPRAAQDLSLRGITETVLSGYEGVEGGFHIPEAGLLGGSGAGPGKAELPRILDVVRRSAQGGSAVVDAGDSGSDLLIIASDRVPAGQPVAWASKRLPLRASGGAAGKFWLVLLAGAGLLGVAAVVWIWYSQRRGLAYIRSGLQSLGTDLTYRLPPWPGEFGEIAQSINDMAERRSALETELRQQDRLAALGRVVAGVAHEIRNPLNSMRLTLDLLNRRTRRGVACSDEIEDAIQQVDRLNMILSRLLAFGRKPVQDCRMQPIDPVIRRAVAMIAEQSLHHGVEVEADTAGDLSATVDASQIEQVLVNLLLNAVDASPKGGKVCVSMAQSEHSVRISVRDFGRGIDAGARPHVFDAYYTTKANGTGLGLAVSREIAVNHGGSLSFDTGSHGTTFVLDLPKNGTSA